MKISRDEIIQYLAYLTVGYFNDETVPPDSVEGYAERVPSIRTAAAQQGDLPWLKLALEHVLLHPEQDWTDLGGPRYPFTNREVLQIVEYVWKTLWPDATLPSRHEAPDIELVPMDFKAWQAHRKTLPQPA